MYVYLCVYTYVCIFLYVTMCVCENEWLFWNVQYHSVVMILVHHKALFSDECTEKGKAETFRRNLKSARKKKKRKDEME